MFEENGVVRVIPENEEPFSDEEMIRECMFHYGWVIDTEDYGLFRDITVDDVKIEDGYHGKVFEGNQSWTEFLKIEDKWKITNVRFVKNIRGVPVYEN